MKGCEYCNIKIITTANGIWQTTFLIVCNQHHAPFTLSALITTSYIVTLWVNALSDILYHICWIIKLGEIATYHENYESHE